MAKTALDKETDLDIVSHYEPCHGHYRTIPQRHPTDIPQTSRNGLTGIWACHVYMYIGGSTYRIFVYLGR